MFLGIKEHRDSFTVEGLSEKQVIKYQKDFWSIVNDRHKVSKNILLNHHVYPVVVEGKTILRIDVPAADRHDKPVYIGVDVYKRQVMVLFVLFHGRAALVDLFIVVLSQKKYSEQMISKRFRSRYLTGISSQQQLRL